MGRIKWQLEDQAFKYLNPEGYQRVAQMVGMQREAREEFIRTMRDHLQHAMDSQGVDCAIQGRAKHFFSISRKMNDKSLGEEEIFDLLGFRIITETVENCYHVLGIIHSRFTPIPNNFKDYIATPKRNGYQSLHTAVIGPEGRVLEIQIRTKKMHKIAEYGVAAHWVYKESGEGSEKQESGVERELDFLRTFIEDLREGEWSEDPSEYMEELKGSLFQDGIFVFTPRGDLHTLPVGATAVDFAYAIHTGVGDRCVGARVAGKMQPLRRPLDTGEVVEIITRNNARPSRDWLSFVKTSKAVTRIRRSLREQESEQSLSLGKELLDREFQKNGKPLPEEAELVRIADVFGMVGSQSLVEGVGRGTLSAVQVFNRAHPPEEKAKILKSAQQLTRLATRLGRRGDKGVRVEGHGNMMIRFAGCCSPVPGDRILGIVTRGRGVSVHRQDCVNVVGDKVPEERRVAVDWESDSEEKYLVTLLITAEDRKNLLADITSKISKLDVNIQGGSFDRSQQDLLARLRVGLEIRDLSEMERIIKEVRKVPGVIEVERN
jgi:GTP pyrophosphokinase